MNLSKILKFLFILCVLFLSACAPKRPILYPNDHFKQVGNATAQTDIDECMQLAAESDAKSSSGRKVAKDTTKGAAVGGATGAAVGAVYGNAGRSAAAGAAGGAAAGLTSGMFDAKDPDPVFRGFVEKCLRDKGYEPIGWK
jgi:hypothetical protein